MISDVLSEAVTEIERHQIEFPNAYNGVKDEIETVKTVMNAMRSYLDLPPAGRYPRYDAAVRLLRNEIAGVNVEGVAAALENVRRSWPTPEQAEAAKNEG